MSVEKAIEFSAAVANNQALRSQVTAAIKGKAPDDCAKTFASIGNSKGYDFTPGEGAVARAEVLSSMQLSDDDLKHVAGGTQGVDRAMNDVRDLFSQGYFDEHIKFLVTQVGSRVGPTGFGGVIAAGVAGGTVSASHGGSASDIATGFIKGLKDASDTMGEAVVSIFSGW